MSIRMFYKPIVLTSILLLSLGSAFGQGKGHGNGHGNGGNGNGNGNAYGREKGGGGGWGGFRGGDQGGGRPEFRQQQKHEDHFFKQEQKAAEWNARQQQRAQQAQQMWQYRQPQVQVSRDPWQQHDNGRGRKERKGWGDDGPRGNAYGLRGIWPGEFRGWRDPEKQARKAQRELEKVNRQSWQAYTYSDRVPYTYSTSRVPYTYNTYRVPDSYYQPRIDVPITRYSSGGDSLLRNILAGVFAQPGQYDYYDPGYSGYLPYQPAETYYSQPYYAPSYYQPAAYYGQGYYGSGYYDPYYSQYSVPFFGSNYGLFGGGGLKSTLLNLAGQMLMSFVGQGYTEGFYQGEYARLNGLRYRNTYDPYYVEEPGNYFLGSASLSEQRRLLSEGYRMGFNDALRGRDLYAVEYGLQRADLVSLFLGEALGRIG